MDYPKALMTIKELVKMGFSEKSLREIASSVGYPVAIRENLKLTSPIKFDVMELDKYLKRTTKFQEGKR